MAHPQLVRLQKWETIRTCVVWIHCCKFANRYINYDRPPNRLTMFQNGVTFGASVKSEQNRGWVVTKSTSAHLCPYWFIYVFVYFLWILFIKSSSHLNSNIYIYILLSLYIIGHASFSPSFPITFPSLLLWYCYHCCLHWLVLDSRDVAATTGA